MRLAGKMLDSLKSTVNLYAIQRLIRDALVEKYDSS
jgi:hypothetical protein